MFDKSSKWIGAEFYDDTRACPIFKRSFNVDKLPQNAVLRISALGFFECALNGSPVSEDIFVPAFSNYRERDLGTLIYPVDDELSYRIYYLEYDVTRLLTLGENCLEVTVGDGYYRQKGRTCEGEVHYGEVLGTRFELYTDGELYIFSDGSEQCRKSFIKESSLHTREVQELTALLCSADGMQSVTVMDEPCSVYEKQTCPADRVTERLMPTLVKRTECGAIYDAGRSVSGRAVLKGLSESVRVRYAELLDADGELELSSCGDYQVQEDVFTGGDRLPFDVTVHARFRWSGFRYFEVIGDAEPVCVEVICADTPVSSAFRCSDGNINFYYDAFINSMRANMHCGIPTDCPHRERLGYTGDGQLTAESAMLTLDCVPFYKKWLLDIYDCQDAKSGHVQHTAPFCGGGGGPGGWGGAVVLLPHAIYKMTADVSVIKEAMPHIHAYLSSMESFCEDGMVTHEYKDGWCLGDWCVPKGCPLPDERLVNTYFYIKCMMIADELASELGEAPRYGDGIRYHGERLVEYFCSEQDGSFGGSRGGADLFAIDIGLADDELKERTYRAYRDGKPIDTGIFGTELLLKLLSEPGRTDGLVNVLSRTDMPSFAYMNRDGSGALWENWNGEESRDHHMFGAGVKYLFYGLLGICIDRKRGEITVSPPMSSALEFVEGTLALGESEGADKCEGEIGSEGKRQRDELFVRIDYETGGGRAKKVTVSLPKGRTCTLRLDGSELPCAEGAHEFEV